MKFHINGTEPWNIAVENLKSELFIGNLEPKKYVDTLANQQKLYKHYFTHMEKRMNNGSNLRIDHILNYAKYINSQDGIVIKLYKPGSVKHPVRVHVNDIREVREGKGLSVAELLGAETNEGRVSHFYKFERKIEAQKEGREHMTTLLSTFIEYMHLLKIQELYIPYVASMGKIIPDRKHQSYYSSYIDRW